MAKDFDPLDRLDRLDPHDPLDRSGRSVLDRSGDAESSKASRQVDVNVADLAGIADPAALAAGEGERCRSLRRSFLEAVSHEICSRHAQHQWTQACSLRMLYR
jgi:hypothetical protein